MSLDNALWTLREKLMENILDKSRIEIPFGKDMDDKNIIQNHKQLMNLKQNHFHQNKTMNTKNKTMNTISRFVYSW